VDLRVSVDHLLEGIQVIDAQWRYVYVNATAAAHGQRSVDELVGRTMMECYPGIETTDLFAVLRRVMESRQRETLRNEFTYPSGERRWFDLLVDPVPDGICILSLDVTDRRKTEIELHHAQRMEAVGKLAGGIAHDFNNQLTAILGFTQLLLERDLDEGMRADLEAINDAAQRSASLTRQLLAFSRRQSMNVEPVDLNQVVRTVDSLLRRLLGEDIQSELILHTEPAMILGDAQQLENVLTNLAVNARDAMPAGGRLTITTAVVELTDEEAAQHPAMRSGRYAVLSVADTGTGIDEDTQAHMFEPFFTTKRLGKGTGLGLASVYGTVKQMGGFIWLYSELNRGTTFRLYFPTTSEMPPPRPEIARVVALPRAASVLVIEDDAGARNLILRTLTDRGYKVVTASDGDEARRLIREMSLEPQLILSDVVLPGESGPELIEQLALTHVKVVFMSGYSEKRLPRQGLGGATLLEKPFTVRELLRAIDEALAP
jgi:two-component system cell cycle sensor histidine kinase/response regulator CckA